MNIDNFLIEYILLFLSYVFLFSFLFRINKINFYNPIVKFVATKIEPISSKILPLGNPLVSSLLFALVFMTLKQLFEYSGDNSLIYILVDSIANLIYATYRILFFAVIGSVILSWVDPNTQHPLAEIANGISEAVLSPIRRYLPPMGGLDFSPIIGLLLLNLIGSFLITLIQSLKALL